MSRLSRREFVRQAGAGFATSFIIAGTKASGRVLGANDVIRIGVAGIRGRGSDHIRAFAKMPGVQVTHLIDPDSRLFEARVAQVKQLGGNVPKCFQDIRKALEDKNLDAISIATCNHWHSLMTIWACQAKKDVYVEKPASHVVFEGRKCIEAARKYGCIVQHGTQSRSDRKWAIAVAAVRSGKYGKLLVAKGYASKPRWSIGFKPIKDPPPELDFDLWLGPAPKQPYHENLVHYNWHWFWDTGNGEIGNQGVHQMDIARWAIGDRLPKTIVSLGGRWVNEPDFKDQGQTPNMHLTVYDYGDVLLVFEVRGLVGKKGRDGKEIPSQVTNEFYCEEGMITAGAFYPKGKNKPEPLPNFDIDIKPGDHFANFIQAVRSRKVEDLNADILHGHLSSALCHLGNISYRLGTPVPFSQDPTGFPMDVPEVRSSWEAIKQNLQNALDIDLSKATYTLGPKLTFDPEKEKFVDNPQADALLTRPPRPPFVVPEKV
ncbi:MAG: Gfo/Idh/MocA family oxidoreductase [Thermoguttaceae bacterium]|nr:Gfo/Idh/MocA family oxidoreductase [Thermoguttaceae bacterium]MDW8038245.1 Gfo/Idh/MocA family oxidoreductase [Thermoguttaceae bacterium]